MQLITTDGVSILDKSNSFIKENLSNKTSKFQQDKKFMSMIVGMITMLFTNTLEIINSLSHINKNLKFCSYFISMEFHL